MNVISKGDLWLLLDNKAMDFAGFLNLSDPNNPLTPTAQNFRVMWDSLTEGIDWDSSLVQNQLVPLLLSQNIIDQGVIDRCNAFSIAKTQI